MAAHAQPASEQLALPAPLAGDLIASPSPRLAQPDGASARTLRSLEVAFVGLQALDVASTLRAMERGHVEANPVMRAASTRPAALLAAKAGSSVATVWLVRRLAKRHRVTAVATMMAIDAGYAWVVARNLRVARR
jgi:hypothetical protein